MAGSAAELDVGKPSGDAVGSAEKENADTTDVLETKFQWRSKFQHSNCLNIATVCPLPRGPNGLQSPAGTSSLTLPWMSPEHTFSPVTNRGRREGRMFTNFTLTSPFSFDMRDSLHRDAHEKKLEELRRMKERHLAVSYTFRANPVRKYKPLIVKQSTRQLTVPKTPFSSRDPK